MIQDFRPVNLSPILAMKRGKLASFSRWSLRTLTRATRSYQRCFRTSAVFVQSAFSSRSRARTRTSSRAIEPPCAMNGGIAWAASPMRITQPLPHVGAKRQDRPSGQCLVQTIRTSYWYSQQFQGYLEPHPIAQQFCPLSVEIYLPLPGRGRPHDV